MTVPIPESPTITALRAAVKDYHEEHGVMGPAADLIGAAAAIITEFDTQTAYVKTLMENPPSPEDVRRILAVPDPPVTVQSGTPWVDPWSEQSASGGQARGTLDP